MKKSTVLLTLVFCGLAALCIFGGEALNDHIIAKNTAEFVAEQEAYAQQEAEKAAAEEEARQAELEASVAAHFIQPTKQTEEADTDTTKSYTSGEKTRTVDEDGNVTITRDWSDPPPSVVTNTANMGGGSGSIEMVDGVYYGEPEPTPAPTPEATPAPTPEATPKPASTPKPEATPAPTPTPQSKPSGYGIYDEDGKPTWKGNIGEVVKNEAGEWMYCGSAAGWLKGSGDGQTESIDDSHLVTGGLSGIKVGSM